jgi:hypothetical protein
MTVANLPTYPFLFNTTFNLYSFFRLSRLPEQDDSHQSPQGMKVAKFTGGIISGISGGGGSGTGSGLAYGGNMYQQDGS